MFPAAARANRSVFYASNGQPRTLSEIYSRFAGKLDQGAAAGGASGLASDGLDGSFSAAARAWSDGDNEVVLGNGAVDSDRHWVQNTLAQLNVSQGANASDPLGRRIDPLRPTPENARLAYLMLANLGA
jgi:hypothetical protein